jgi:hypothetical protein
MDCPESSARYSLREIECRPVSIFLRVLTGFFIFGDIRFHTVVPVPVFRFQNFLAGAPFRRLHLEDFPPASALVY